MNKVPLPRWCSQPHVVWEILPGYLLQTSACGKKLTYFILLLLAWLRTNSFSLLHSNIPRTGSCGTRFFKGRPGQDDSKLPCTELAQTKIKTLNLILLQFHSFVSQLPSYFFTSRILYVYHSLHY